MGGTFDPVHNAHLRLATDALENLKLEAVRWIPSGAPGHRATPLATPAQRVDMLKLALAEEPRFILDTAEVDSGAPTYTLYTLRRLRAELGAKRPLIVLIGMDSLINLHTWREWEKLFELAHFAVAERPGAALDPARLDANLAALYRERLTAANELSGMPAGRIAHFATVPMGISASDIRARCASGTSIRYLIPAVVVRYIESESLYV